MQANLMTRVLDAYSVHRQAKELQARRVERVKGWGAKCLAWPITLLWRGRPLPNRETWGIARTQAPRYLVHTRNADATGLTF